MIKIVFIDSNYSDHNFLKTALPKEYQIISAYRAARGIQLVEEEHPDIVLLNRELPEMKNIEVVLKLNQIYSKPPIIICHDVFDSKSVVDAFKCGAVDFVLKPFHVSDLCECFNKYLSKTGLHKVIEENIIPSIIAYSG